MLLQEVVVTERTLHYEPRVDHPARGARGGHRGDRSVFLFVAVAVLVINETISSTSDVIYKLRVDRPACGARGGHCGDMSMLVVIAMLVISDTMSSFVTLCASMIQRHHPSAPPLGSSAALYCYQHDLMVVTVSFVGTVR